MSSEEGSDSLSNENSNNDELNFKDDEDKESNKFKVPENNSEKKSESLNFKEDEEKESNKFKVSNHSQSKKSDDNKSESQKSQSQKSESKKSENKNSESKKNENDNKSESQKSQSKKSESQKSKSKKTESKKLDDNKSEDNKSQSQKSESKKSENKNSESKKNENDNKSESQKSQSQKSESQKSKSKKTESKKNDDNKSEDNKSQSQKSESQKSKSKKSESKKSENKNSESKKSSLPNINSNIIIESEKNSKKSQNNPFFNDIITGDPNDENLNLPPLSYNNKYIKTPSETSKNSSKKLKLNNETEEKKSEYSKSSKFKKSKKSNYEEKKSESKIKIINEETKMKEPPHENSINPYRIQFNNENDKSKLNDLLCNQCENFPLNPISCSECNTIFCKECINENNKCLNCNSIFKQGEILEELKNLYSNIKINCKYKECGCDEILSSNELLNHENNCKSKIGKCTFCNNEFKYEELYFHIKNCKNNERKCIICGYKDTYEEYNKTDKKIEHIKHILLPDITNIIKSEMNKFYKHLFEEKEEKKKLQNKGEEQIDIMKNQGEKIMNLENIINEISENIKKIQSSPSHNAVGLSIATNELKNKLKSIKLINNISNTIDNGFECDNKFCIIQTLTNDYIIVYPNLKYGIDIYNLSNNQIENVIKKAHDSNITCMTYSQNKKKNLTYLITASFDRSINIYSIEDGWKKIKNFNEAHNDYSIFSLDSFYDENKGIISISGNHNLSEIKIWFCDSEDNNKIIKINNNKIFCIKHNPKNLDEIYIGTDEGILLFLISKITESENKPEKNLQDKNYDKSNHICITFLDNNEYNLIEGDSIGKIRIWGLNNNELIKIFERGILTFQINTLENWDDRFVIGGSRDGKIILFDVIDGVQVNEIGSHNGYVYCVKIATHWKYGKIIVSSGFDGVLKLWGSTENN